MSNLLESYDVEFKTLYESTKLEISNGSSSKTTTIRNLEINKDDLLEILEQMNIEVNNTGSSTEEKSKWRSYLRNLKNDLQKDIVDPLNKLIEDENRNVLFSTQGATPEVDNGISYMDEEQRQQLLDSHHILNKTNKRLMDAQRVAYDTEQIGSQIMNDLRAQRETLEHSRNHLSQADTYLDKSVRTLRVMSRRLVANKIISYSIIAVLILLILLVLYSKFR